MWLRFLVFIGGGRDPTAASKEAQRRSWEDIAKRQPLWGRHGLRLSPKGLCAGGLVSSMLVSVEAPVTDATGNHYNRPDRPDLKRQIQHVSSHKQNLKLKLYMWWGEHTFIHMCDYRS